MNALSDPNFTAERREPVFSRRLMKLGVGAVALALATVLSACSASGERQDPPTPTATHTSPSRPTIEPPLPTPAPTQEQSKPTLKPSPARHIMPGDQVIVCENTLVVQLYDSEGNPTTRHTIIRPLQDNYGEAIISLNPGYPDYDTSTGEVTLPLLVGSQYSLEWLDTNAQSVDEPECHYQQYVGLAPVIEHDQVAPPMPTTHIRVMQRGVHLRKHITARDVFSCDTFNYEVTVLAEKPRDGDGEGMCPFAR